MSDASAGVELDAACSPGAHFRATKQPHILLLALFLCLYVWVPTRRVHRQAMADDMLKRRCLCVRAGLACPTCRWEPAPCKSAAASHAPSPSLQPAGLWCAPLSEPGSRQHTGSATATPPTEGQQPDGPPALPTHSSCAETGIQLSASTHAVAAAVACLPRRRRSGTCLTTGTWWARWAATSRTTSPLHCLLAPSAGSLTMHKVSVVCDRQGSRQSTALSVADR